MKINPKSVRNFEDFIVSYKDGDFSCKTTDATDFLYELITVNKEEKILYLSITDDIIVNDTGVILDGNIRMYLKYQLQKIKHHYRLIITPINIKKVLSSDEDLYLYQIKRNNTNPLSVKQRLKALDSYINNYISQNPSVTLKEIRHHIKENYGDTLYNYACILDNYNDLPLWLKNEGEKLNVSPRVLIRFHKELETETNWHKVVRDAIHNSKNQLKITDKNIDSVIDSIPKSESLLSKDIDTLTLSDEELREQCLKAFEAIKRTIPTVSLNEYDCKNWKRLLKILDEFYYIIENV